MTTLFGTEKLEKVVTRISFMNPSFYRNWFRSSKRPVVEEDLLRNFTDESLAFMFINIDLCNAKNKKSLMKLRGVEHDCMYVHCFDCSKKNTRVCVVSYS